VTVGLQRAATGAWQIADLLFANGRLAAGLRAAAAQNR
jgi:hypothetical protein